MSSFPTALKFSSRLKQQLRSSDRDKLTSNNFEYILFGLIKVDILALVKMKASLAKNFHIQPTEIDKMPMWEYELFIQALNAEISEENEKQQKEMDKYDIEGYKKMASPKHFEKMTQPQTKIPNNISSMKI